jgi:hypothetical protein
MSWLRQRPAWAAALAALALRLALMAGYPALFGGDSVVRLANADKVFLSYQLPALQAVIHMLWVIAPGQWPPRLFVALMGAVAVAGFFGFARTLMPQTPALVAALLFGLNPFLTAYSIVPYQEMLMLAGLSWAFAWAAAGRHAPAAGALALACWTRYEAWPACPAVFWMVWSNGPRNTRRALAWGALCAAPPLAWMALQGGIAPMGSFAVEHNFSLERLWRWIYVGWITMKHSWFALPAAALGLWALARERRWREPSWQAILGFGTLLAGAILFSAHGERDRPERYVTAREAHLPISFVCLAAGYGLVKLGRARVQVGLAMLALTVVSAQRFVKAETSAPHVALAYRAARFLEETLEPGQTAAVLAKPIPADMLDRFLETAGDREAALRTLLSLHTGPPDYQRILVQTSLGRERLISFSRLPLAEAAEAPKTRPDWVLRWSDFGPTSDHEEALAEAVSVLAPAEVLRQDGIQLSLYRLPD